ncbi:MAG: L-seryl-tRNA(Sec) selenium transferase, partial [Planctomycetota bacterium]|nr:L-seryl-tRNA(Sec) selenium transferase [Planctomycetota bacterium]
DLRALTGAESATVVNNNAAAVLLALHALAGGREVLVSRGELVEIGGGFRIPDIMSLSGANLVEVGTTNRTYVRDFDRAVNSETALMLSVHTSNYRVVGFQHSPDRGDLVALAAEREIPLLEDIGSGLLSSVVPDLLAAEPNARDAIEAGVDLVCFSGDKLLGGPQAGILVGREDLIRRCREDAFFRPSRPDRLCLAALGATLRLHIEDPQAVPVLFALNQPSAQRLDRARHLVRLFRGRFPEATFEAVETHGEVGSGSAPTKEVRSASVEITWPGLDADALASQLRKNSPSVYGRVWRSKFQLDVFAFLPGDDERVEEALSALDQEG